MPACRWCPDCWWPSTPDGTPDLGEVGYPLMLKAAAGGGGRGMRRVDDPADLPHAMAAAAREAQAAFGDGTLYAERMIAPARHIEVQLLGDRHGGLAVLGERDCSVQRRHQKLVEETPSPAVTPDVRAALADERAAGGRHGRLPQRRHRRVPARRRWRPLLPGDEHPSAGRARRHRAGDRHRHRGLADPRGRRACRWTPPSWSRASPATPSRSGSMPRIRTTDSGRWPARSPPGTRPMARASASITPWPRGGRSPPSTTRCWPSSWSTPMTGRRRWPACGGRSMRRWSAALQTDLGFHRWLVDHPGFVAGDYHTGLIAEDWPEAAPPDADDLALAATAAIEARRASAAAGQRPGRRRHGRRTCPTGPGWHAASALRGERR